MPSLICRAALPQGTDCLIATRAGSRSHLSFLRLNEPGTNSLPWDAAQKAVIPGTDVGSGSHGSRHLGADATQLLFFPFALRCSQLFPGGEFPPTPILHALLPLH